MTGKVKDHFFIDTPNENAHEFIAVLCKKHKTEMKVTTNFSNVKTEELCIQEQKDIENGIE